MAVLRGPAEHRPAGARRGRACAMLIGCDFCEFPFGNSLCESLNAVSDRESGFPKAVFATIRWDTRLCVLYVNVMC